MFTKKQVYSNCIHLKNVIHDRVLENHQNNSKNSQNKDHLHVKYVVLVNNLLVMAVRTLAMSARFKMCFNYHRWFINAIKSITSPKVMLHPVSKITVELHTVKINVLHLG